MADLDLGAGAFGGKVKVAVKAVPPFGWVGAVALGAVVVLAWHFWDQDAEDTSGWTDPEQPPVNTDVALLKTAAPVVQQSPSWNDNALRGRRIGSPAPGAV